MSKIGQHGSGQSGLQTGSQDAAPWSRDGSGSTSRNGGKANPFASNRQFGAWDQTGSDLHGQGHGHASADLLRQQIERAGHDQGHGDHTDHHKHDTQVLAEAGTAAPAFMVAPAPQAAPAPDAAPAVTSAPGSTSPEQAATERRVSGMVDWVDHALRTEVPPDRMTTPVKLAIPLDSTAAGVTGVTLVATKDGVDITLTRGAGDADPALVSAAQALAERIQQRLGKGRVRVLDAVEKKPAMAHPLPQGLAAFSTLFDPDADS